MDDELNPVEVAAEPEDTASRIAGLEGELAEKTEELRAAREHIAELEQKLAEVGNRLAQAVTSYWDLAVKASPGVTGELITGDSIEEIDASVEKAKSLVSRVKQEIEGQAARVRVPGGAPVRGSPDLSVLSPREKIQQAIGGKK